MPRTVEIEDASKGTTGSIEPIARELRPLLVLGQVLAWATARKPRAKLLETIAQDEFTHDVVFALDSDRWLAFDVT